MNLDFPGAAELIDTLDAAVVLDGPDAITDAIRAGLCELIGSGTLRVPECCLESKVDGYARRELYCSEEHAYAVIAMTWGPGQRTQLHDHSGLWCVEGVVAGQIEVTQYELRERDAERYRFDCCGTIRAGVGTAGSLIPPHEHHVIANPMPDQLAISVHVYSAQMSSCQVYTPLGGGWYRRESRCLALDAAA